MELLGLKRLKQNSTEQKVKIKCEGLLVTKEVQSDTEKEK